MLLNRHMRRRATALGKKSQTSNTSSGRSQSSALVTGSIAAGALMLAAPSAAFAQTIVPPSGGPCVVSGATATCTGDVSAGVEAVDPLDTLNVNKLNQAITPAAGIDGIHFYRAGGGDITINADTGTYGITTTAFGAGIDAYSNAPGDITITSMGDIDADGFGIRAQVNGSGDVTISHTGDISSKVRSGVYVANDGDGDLKVTIVGDVTSDVSDGIVAERNNGNGDAIIDSTGNIQADRNGIRGANYGSGGDVMITSVGDITSDTNIGIYGVRISGVGKIVIESTGKIQASNYGIKGANYGTGGDVMVTSVGDVTSDFNDGIFGIRTGGAGNTIIDSTGNIQADSNGIRGANYGSGGDVMITSVGDLTSDNNNGIYGIRVSGDGDTIIDSTGNIQASSYGIRGANYGSGGDVMITSVGDVTSMTSEGIFGIRVSGDGDIIIESTGNIQADRSGIRGSNYGSGGDVMITSNGDVTSDNNRGIYGIRTNGVGDIIFESTGNIQADREGILGLSYGTGGDVMITSIGNITSDNSSGISSRLIGGVGDTIIDSTGNIDSDDTAIYVYHRVDGNVDIVSHGDIVALNGGGIYGWHYGIGNVNITSTGNIVSEDAGLYGYLDLDGDIKIVNNGNITSNVGYGIIADIDSGEGNITIDSKGDIKAGNYGIYAAVENGGIVSVTSVGNITSAGTGIAAWIDSANAAFNSVTVNSTGNIMTTDNSADGIYAYVDNGSGDATITSVGNVTTMGDNAHGLYAYIDGGNDGSTASITSTGDVKTMGNNSYALLAYADVDDFATINIVSGLIQGGGGNGAGVNFSGAAGSTNTLNIYGPVTISSLGGTAINGGAGDTTINNWGTLNTVTDGDILLGGGTNAFNNYAGGIFHSGANVDLGGDFLFDNHGTFSPGGDGNIFATDLTGQFNQTASGILMTDVDMTANTSDLLNVKETAELGGNVRVHVINPAFGPTQSTILTAVAGTTDNGLGVLASPALQAELSYPNANDVDLSTDLDFTAPGAELNDNQTSVAETVSSGLSAGGGALDPVILALLNGPTDNPGYQMALDQLGGESFLNEDNAALFGAEAFGGQMFSCQVNGEQYAAISEGSCLWVRPIQGYTFDRDGTASSVGFDGEAFGTSVGGQTEFSPDWFAGIALGFEHGDLTTDTGVVSDRESYNAGLSLKHTMGAFAVSGALFAGTSHFDTTRTIAIGGLTATNMSSHNVTSFGARARGAYVHEFGGGAFIKPMVDFSLVHLDRGGFSETGTAATALTIAGSSDTYFSATPAVEFGIDHQTKENQIVRFYGKAGVAIYADDGHSLSGSFTNAPAGTAGFVSNTEFDNVFAEVEAGFTFMDDGAATIQLGFQGRYSENSAQSGGFIKANMEF